MRDACVVSSLKYDSLRKIKEADDSIETAYITSVSYGNFTDLEYADGYSVAVSYTHLDVYKRQGPARRDRTKRRVPYVRSSAGSR